MIDSTGAPIPLIPLAKINGQDTRYTNNQLFLVTKNDANFDTEHSVKFMDNNNVYRDITRGDKFTQLGSLKKPRTDRATIEAKDRWHFKVEGFIHDFHIQDEARITLMLFKAFNTFNEDSLKEFAQSVDKQDAYYAVMVSSAPEGESEDRVIFGVIDTNKKNRYILKGFDFNASQTVPEIILDNTEEIADFLAVQTFE